jgi:hypothetical protein
MLPFPAVFFGCGKQQQCQSFLGAFANLGKATISPVMSVRLSVHMEQLCSNFTDFHDVVFENLSKICREIEVLLSDKNNGYSA